MPESQLTTFNIILGIETRISDAFPFNDIIARREHFHVVRLFLMYVFITSLPLDNSVAPVLNALPLWSIDSGMFFSVHHFLYDHSAYHLSGKHCFKSSLLFVPLILSDTIFHFTYLI